MFGQGRDVVGIATRLAAAAQTAESLELILVVRGKVRPVRGTEGRRWLAHTEAGNQLTFSAEWVLAATPVARVQQSRPP